MLINLIAHILKTRGMQILMLIILMSMISSLVFPQTYQPITNFPPGSYGIFSQNFSIVQDKRGIIYIANFGCVLEYDGVQWRKYITKNYTPVVSLNIDKNGRVYVGAFSEFGYLDYDSSGRKVYTDLTSLLPDSLQDFISVKFIHVIDEIVVFNAFKYIFLYKNGQLKVLYPQKEFFKSHKVNNTFWVQEIEYGLYRYEYNILTFIKGSEFLADKNVSAILLYNDKMMIATQKHGLFLFDVDKVLPLKTDVDPHLINAKVNGGTITHTGDFIFNTLNNGLFVLSPSSINVNKPTLNGQTVKTYNLILNHHISRDEGLQNENIHYIFQDKTNHCWVALNNGISIVDIYNPISFIKEGISFNGSVYGITHHNGAFYIATPQGVYRFNNTQRISNPKKTSGNNRFELVEGIDSQCRYLLSTGLSHDPLDGELFVAAFNGGVYLIEDKITDNKPVSQLIHYPGDPGLGSISVARNISKIYASVLAQPKGMKDVIIAGGRKGLSLLKKKNGKWVNVLYITDLQSAITTITPVTFNNTYKINVKDDSFAVWLGSWTKGTTMLTFDNNLKLLRKQYFDTTQGLPAGPIQTFTLKNNVIFGTQKGLYKYYNSDPQFTGGKPGNNKTQFSKLFFPDTTLGIQFTNGSREVKLLEEDMYGSVWILQTKGIWFNRCIPTSNGNYIIDSISFASLNIDQPSIIYPDKNNVCWFGGFNGLMRYDANVEKDYKPEYYCLIRTVTVGKDSIIFTGNLWTKTDTLTNDSSPTDGVNLMTNVLINKALMFNQPIWMIPKLEYNDRDIRFEFAAPFFERSDKIEYSWFLEGYDSNWSKWKKETRISYTNLNEGNFTFHVKAKNIYHHISEEGAYTFTILPPFHRTWWFYGIQIGVLAFLFGIAFYFFRKGGKTKRIATVLVTVAIIIVFEYIEDIAETQFVLIAGSVTFFKILLNATLVFALLPIEKILKRMMMKKE